MLQMPRCKLNNQRRGENNQDPLNMKGSRSLRAARIASRLEIGRKILYSRYDPSPVQALSRAEVYGWNVWEGQA